MRKNFVANSKYCYSTTPKSKYISVGRYDEHGEGKPFRYIPKTRENLKEIMRVAGKPDVFDDKRYGKRLIWF